MGVRHHEQLRAWQLAYQLYLEIVALTAKPHVAKDRKFCDQILGSGSSAPTNTSEGFWRFKPRDFARFLRIARGSLGETQTHLRVALARRYIEETEFRRLFNLADDAIRATSGLVNYLHTAKEPGSEPHTRRTRQGTRG